jgi:PAS domain S-box-containing protein
VEHSADAVVWFDLDDRVRAWNAAAERMFGWVATEVLGRPSPIVPQGRDEERREMVERVRRGEVIGHFHTECLCKDGSLLDVAVSYFPVIDVDGELVGICSSIRDVSETRRQKRLIERLLGVARSFARVLSREEVLEEVFDQARRHLSADGVWFLRSDPPSGLLVPERGFGPALQTTGPAGIRPADLPAIAAALSEHRVVPIRDLSTVPGGLVVRSVMMDWGGVMVVPLLLEDQPLGVLAVGFKEPRLIPSEDLTLAAALGDEAAVALHRASLVDRLSEEVEEERAAIERLEDIERARSEILATISHDFRAPLTSIKGFVSTLLRREDAFDADERRDILSVVDRQATRLARMIDNLLTASEVEAGVRRNPVVQTVPIEPLLQELAEEAAILSDRHRIEVAVSDHHLSVLADPDDVRRAVSNLLDNAIKYSPSGGTVTLSGEPIARRVRLSVSDQGPGIPPEDVDRLFSRFGRLQTERSGVASTGLGLFIVRRLVEGMGGSVSVQSEPGEGSVFAIDLPRAEGMASAAGSA